MLRCHILKATHPFSALQQVKKLFNLTVMSQETFINQTLYDTLIVVLLQNDNCRITSQVLHQYVFTLKVVLSLMCHKFITFPSI